MNIIFNRSYFRAVFVLVVAVNLLSCNSKPNDPSNNPTIVSDKVENLYAKGFTIEKHKDYKVVSVFNPWQHAQGIVFKYILADDISLLPDSLKKYTVIQTPVKKLVCLSTTHIAFLKALHQEKVISGIAAPEFVYDADIRSQVNNGKILNVGYDQAINIETIISLKPDFVMAYGVGSEASGQFERLKQLGVKVVFNAEYLENTPLGKAEWIKFVGAFCNQEDSANAFFQRTVYEYKELVKLASKTAKKPVILSGLPWKGVWYVPGGNSYASSFIKDAGGDYLWNSDKGTESIPLSLETVMEKANNAKIWINPGSVLSLSEIASLDSRMKSVTSFLSQQVYNFNARTSPGGGNDFWESGVVYPQVILKDLISVFHPELLPNHTFVYYNKLK